MTVAEATPDIFPDMAFEIAENLMSGKSMFNLVHKSPGNMLYFNDPRDVSPIILAIIAIIGVVTVFISIIITPLVIIMGLFACVLSKESTLYLDFQATGDGKTFITITGVGSISTGASDEIVSRLSLKKDENENAPE